MRTHFMPPLVEPAQAPIKETNSRGTHVQACHSWKSFVVKPVVVPSEVTWKAAARRLCSMPKPSTT